MTEIEDRFRAAALACTDTWSGTSAAARPRRWRCWPRPPRSSASTSGTGTAPAARSPGSRARSPSCSAGLPAVFFVSGVMAQQAALRVWCERRRSQRVAIPDLAHQLHHETDGPRLLQGFRFETLTSGWETATADGLRALPGVNDLGAVQLELPLRDAGCLLPTWDELSASRRRPASSACRSTSTAPGCGSRSRSTTGRWPRSPGWPTPSTSPSTRGCGRWPAPRSSATRTFAAELRGWRQRMGGTLFGMTPYAVSALVGLRDELPHIGESVAWARALADELVGRGLRLQPAPPHTNTFLVFADGDPEAITGRVAEFMEKEQVAPCGGWWAAKAPGRRDDRGDDPRRGARQGPGHGRRVVRRPGRPGRELVSAARRADG